jgi:hypothetical protein
MAQNLLDGELCLVDVGGVGGSLGSIVGSLLLGRTRDRASAGTITDDLDHTDENPE